MMSTRWSSRNSAERLERMQKHNHALLHVILWKVIKMSAAMDRLTREVSETGTAIDSALALIEGIAQQIRDLPATEAAQNALADELDAKQAAIAAAIVANTPAEEPPVEPPVEPPAEPPVDPDPVF